MWREGQLEAALEDVQCSLAVEGANEAAAVARRVQVGEGTLGGALGLLLADPTTWAYGAALVLAVLQRPLTPTVGGAAVEQGCAWLNRAVGKACVHSGPGSHERGAQAGCEKQGTGNLAPA